MKKVILTLFVGICLISASAFSQSLFTEDFTGYTAGSLIGQGGWAQGAGTTFPSVASATPLTYAGYPLGGGNYVTMPAYGGATARVTKTFSPTGAVAQGNVYYISMLVNFSAVTANSVAYTWSLGDAAGSSSNLCPKLYAKAGVGANTFNIGISKQTTNIAGITYGTTDFNLNQTYLVVIEYKFNTLGAGHDDEVYLWVNPDLSSEPVTTVAECQNNGVTNTTDVDFDNYQTPAGGIGSVIWNSRGTTAPIGSVDGIKVSYGTSSAAAWGYLSLPVELTSFTASSSKNSVNLKWSTATELNNTGFQIERSSNNSGWSKLGFVSGNGNSNSVKNYFYADNSVTKSGKYYYRLKQIDVNGTYKYSNTAEVDFIAPSVFSLNQNYPNPFNPSTVIAYSIPNASNVKLSVYNAIGQVVDILENGYKDAGNYSVTFNASNLPSGLYFYKIEAGQFSQTRKMMLLK